MSAPSPSPTEPGAAGVIEPRCRIVDRLIRFLPRSRRLVLHYGHFATLESDVIQRQEWQIVQSQLDLRDFLP